MAEATIELGTYRLQPMTAVQLLQDLPPAYRLVSVQESVYLVSTDTGLSYRIDGTGTVTQLDKSDTVVSEPTRVFAAADDAVWLVTAKRLKHSKGQDGIALTGDKVRVLWFSARQILLWGEYQRSSEGGTASGLQLYSLKPGDRVEVTKTISAEEIQRQVATFVGAEKFIAGGVFSQQDFWLWTREGGLLVMRDLGKGAYGVEERTVISLPRIAGKVFKDIGFTLQMTAEEITPPTYVLGLAAGRGNRGALHIAIP